MSFDYSKELLEEKVKQSVTLTDLCRNIGIGSNGGNFKTIKKYLKLYNIDISHFNVGSIISRNRYEGYGVKKELSEILVKDSTYASSSRLKKRLYDSGLKEYKCEKCGITDWLGEKIVLELEHINGDNLDHRIENLLILCPNCHSQTDTYCSKTKSIGVYKSNNEIFGYVDKPKEFYFCSECGDSVHEKGFLCVKCSKILMRKVKDRPTKEQLRVDLLSMTYVAIGKKYGVSDNTIRKWLKNKYY